MRKGALRGYRGYVAISQHVKDSAVEHLGLRSERITVIYRGTPPEATPVEAGVIEAARHELGLGGVGPLLLTVGRLVPQKGQRYLIQAMPAVRRTFPNVRLLVTGTGFLESELRRLAAELGVADAVRFLGRRDDLKTLMGLADVFVFPSVYEGLGVSLLEAATAGMACIASRVGPIPEVISDGVNGVLVAPQSPTELAAAIVRLAGDADLRHRLGARASCDARARFSIARAAAQLESLYDAVLAGELTADPRLLPLEAELP
jgi:glycosyltransferase involved in cell wall biosynthesis